MAYCIYMMAYAEFVCAEVQNRLFGYCTKQKKINNVINPIGLNI